VTPSGAPLRRSRRLHLPGWALALAIAFPQLLPGYAAASVSFSTAPSTPNLPAVTLNGQAQTDNATMANWGVKMLSSQTGWNVTVAGDTTSGKSAVFKQYCPNTTCGTDSGPGYITGGATLAAGSLKLNSTGASWTGNSGTTPSHLCNSGCLMDTTTAVKIASASTSVLTGTWSTTGYSATSLAASIPTTTRFLSQSGEVYHLDLVFTLNSGP
jgi:hypothetical protein